jgi:hypothetical protein
MGFIYFNLCDFIFSILLLFCHYYFAAITTKIRLDLIKTVALAVVRDLKAKAESTYADMNDWLGAKFLGEMQGYEIKALDDLTLRWSSVTVCSQLKHW